MLFTVLCFLMISLFLVTRPEDRKIYAPLRSALDASHPYIKDFPGRLSRLPFTLFALFEFSLISDSSAELFIFDFSLIPSSDVGN